MNRFWSKSCRTRVLIDWDQSAGMFDNANYWRWIRRKREIENWESRQRIVVNPWRRSRYYLMHLPKLECLDTEIRSILRSWRCSRSSKDFKTDFAHLNCGAEGREKIPSMPEIITPANLRLIYLKKMSKQKIEINFITSVSEIQFVS